MDSVSTSFSNLLANLRHEHLGRMKTLRSQSKEKKTEWRSHVLEFFTEIVDPTTKPF